MTAICRDAFAAAVAPSDTGAGPHSEDGEEPPLPTGREALPARRRAFQIPTPVAGWERRRSEVAAALVLNT